MEPSITDRQGSALAQRRDEVPTLDLATVSKRFNPGTEDERIGLAEVSLRLHAGEFAVVIGGNGTGKSTLVNAIAGEARIDAGVVRIDGNDVTYAPAHARARWIARVFQDPATGTAPELSIEENLAVAENRGQPRRYRVAITRESRARYRSVLAPLGLGLEERLGARVQRLSGGQRQALCLAMATLGQPRLLLLDEHTAALDPRIAESVMAATVRQVRERKLTTVMVTHNMQHAIDHGDRLLMLAGGRIVLDVSGSEKASLRVEHLVARFGMAGSRMLLG